MCLKKLVWLANARTHQLRTHFEYTPKTIEIAEMSNGPAVSHSEPKSDRYPIESAGFQFPNFDAYTFLMNWLSLCS